MRLRFPLALLVLLLSGTAGACAQEVAGTSAQEAMQVGNYTEARSLFRSLLPSSPEAAIGYLETFEAVGDYQEGLAEAATMLVSRPDDPYVLHMQGRLLAAVGRYAEAEAAFLQVLNLQPDLLRNVLELGAVLEATGRKAEARRLYSVMNRRYEEGRYRTAEDLAVVGRALARLEAFREANNAFRTAHQIDARYVQNLAWWADIFREKYNTADAERTYQEALGVNPNRADLYVGYAHAVPGFGQQEKLAQEALEKNPNSVAALDLLASLRVLDAQYDEAETMARRALSVNPASVSSLAHLAAIHHLRGDTAAFAATERQALAVNSRAGGFYLTLAEDVERRFRYPDALAFSLRAATIERDNWAAYASVGINLLRAGRAVEAKRYLDVSFERDPFNLFVGNTLTLMDEYEDFVLLESEHFRLRIHRDESDVLGAAMLDLAETAYADFQGRYGYTPADKILIEAYNDHDDFAVRVGGIPHLGLLGVCFGDVVALDTPRAQEEGTYNWARTLWHELGHTMAIGVSDFKVPRWFTEGLSVYEEQRARPEWGREMDLELFTAFDQDRLLPLAQIDRGFTRPSFPGQVILSYYHASKIIGFIADTYGFQAVVDILQRLRAGDAIEAALETVLQQKVSALDNAFRENLKAERSRFAGVLAGLPDLLETEEAPALSELVGAGADNAFLKNLREGNDRLRQERYDEAEAQFLEALNRYPGYAKAGSPYHGLAAVYHAQGRTDKLIEILERFLTVSEHGAEEARELGDLYREQGDTARATRYLSRTLDVTPYDRATHMALAELYTEQNLFADAVRARRAVIALNPVDLADAYYQLALSLFRNREVEAARRAVLQSLERAPGFRDAQKLLLQCVDGAGP